MDVAAAGGWSDIGTLMKCYQQADDHTLLEVMSHPALAKSRSRNACDIRTGIWTRSVPTACAWFQGASRTI